MFSALRQNASLYILEKGEDAKLRIGIVESVSAPQPKMQLPYGQPQETMVEIVAKVDNETMRFQNIPSTAVIAYNGNVVVSETKDAMLMELENMLRNSNQIIDSIGYHKELVKKCNQYIEQLNPAIAEKRMQEEKIVCLEEKIGGMETALSNIQKMLSSALNNKKE